MATIPTVSNFDLTKIPVEGTAEFRANASYVWSTIPGVISSMNNSIAEMNNLSTNVDTVLAYTQEATSQADIATQQATAAANSAATASTSEANAATSEANALTSENNAATSAAIVDLNNIIHTIGSGLPNEGYTKAEVDIKLDLKALKNGDKTQTFKVANAVNVDEAVSKAQLNSKALKNGDNTKTFKVADAVNADEAVSKGQFETSYATSTVGGTIKARLDGTTLYITTDGSDA